MNISSDNQSPPARASRGQSLRFLVPSALLIAGAVMIWSGADVALLTDWLDSLGFWAPIAFVLISIAMMSVLLPKTAVSVTAGALFGTVLGSVLMVIIALAAAALNYAIGRWWLHDSIRQSLQRRQLDGDSQPMSWMHAISELAGEAGFGTHLLIRLSPVPTMLISYSMGAAGGRVRPYLLAAVVAIIPQVLWVHGGSAAAMIHQPDPSTLRWISVGLSIVIAIAISIVVPRAAMKRLNELRSPLPDDATSKETTI